MRKPLLLAALALAAARPAFAQAPPKSPPAAERPAPDAPPGEGDRPPPAEGAPAKAPEGAAPAKAKAGEPVDYDGRPEPGASAGEVALWVPRVVLFPLYLVSEFVVRRPLGAFAVAAERGRWVPKAIDFFTFGPDKKGGFVPTALFDFGLRPSVGLYFFYDDAFHEKNDIRLYGATGGIEFLHFTATDRVRLDDKGVSSVAVRGDFLRRSDFVYHGLGPRSRQADRTRFDLERVEAGVLYNVRLSGHALFHTYVGVREADFRRGCCFGRRLKPLVEAGEVEAPPGYPEGYTNIFQHAEVVFDTRPEDRPFFDGARIRLEAEQGSDVRREGDGPSRWLRYGGSLKGFVNVSRDRVVSLSATALLADRLSGSRIPFTEQIVLGGDIMPAYLPGRLVGQSALVATFEYTWPVWAALQGYAQVAVGNVFGRHFEGAEAGLLRGNAGIGLRSTSSRDHALEVLIAAGTEPFDDRFQVNSFRLRIGGSSGF